MAENRTLRLNPLSGTFAFLIHGVMHAPANDPVNSDWGKYIVPKNSDGTLRTHTPVGIADPSMQQMMKIYEHPAMTAFYPTEYPLPYLSPGAADACPTRCRREATAPPLTPTVGYYPLVESGFMTLELFSKTVEGAFRGNYAGYPSQDYVDFKGQIAYGGVTGIVTGVISLRFSGNHIWSYGFIKVSEDEVTLMTLSRVPRPAIASGTMKRVTAHTPLP
jgi:hypothetical protein